MVLDQDSSVAVLEDDQSDTALSILFSQLHSGSSLHLLLCACALAPHHLEGAGLGPQHICQRPVSDTRLRVQPQKCQIREESMFSFEFILIGLYWFINCFLLFFYRFFNCLWANLAKTTSCCN